MRVAERFESRRLALDVEDPDVEVHAVLGGLGFGDGLQQELG